jgi:hypothetical protein
LTATSLCAARLLIVNFNFIERWLKQSYCTKWILAESSILTTPGQSSVTQKNGQKTLKKQVGAFNQRERANQLMLTTLLPIITH